MLTKSNLDVQPTDAWGSLVEQNLSLAPASIVTKSVYLIDANFDVLLKSDLVVEQDNVLGRLVGQRFEFGPNYLRLLVKRVWPHFVVLLKSDLRQHKSLGWIKIQFNCSFRLKYWRLIFMMYN